MKQLDRIFAVSLVVIATIVGITFTTVQSNKLRNTHHTRMEQSLTFKSISNKAFGLMDRHSKQTYR